MLNGFLTSVVPFVVILVLLVVIHELGHFVTAKLAGITVREFGFGYPPRLFGFTYKGTIYSVNALPLAAVAEVNCPCQWK